MDPLPRPRFVACIGLLLYFAVLLGAMRLSWIALQEAMLSAPPTLKPDEVARIKFLMTLRIVVHLTVLATGAVSLAGTVLRRPWGRSAALAFLPARLGAVAILFLAGLGLGLNPLMDLEHGVLTTTLFNIPMVMPLYWFSKELKAWYRHGIAPERRPSEFDPSDPYRR